jgi:hypothetical protein
MAAEQTSIELIFEKQNELNIDDFNLWLTSSYEELKSQHKMEVMGAYEMGQEDNENYGYSSTGSLNHYIQFYGE